MKTLRLDLETLHVTTFEAGQVAMVHERDARTPESTCLYTQCPWTD